MTDESAEGTKTVVVVMGVAGSGKTTIAERLGAYLRWTVAEADNFHSPANVAKMAAGTPLTDADRWPWLDSIVVWMNSVDGNAVITCSALKRIYRDRLATADARVRFLHLSGSHSTVGTRMASRSGHFMPTSLLDSQFATLEPLQPGEDGVAIDITGTPDEVLQRALDALGLARK